MGCDIHLYVEKRVDDKSPWVTADKWTQCEYSEPGVLSVNYKDHIYSGRSYDLFSILANVRNGSGFAGVKTGEGFVPISEPRGVPDDACDEYKRAVEEYGCDGHSHSHLTVAELLAYDWTQETTHQGYVDIDNYAKWKQNGKPESWSGFVGGPSITHHTPEEVAAVVESLGIKPWGLYHDNEGCQEKVAARLGAGRPYTLVKWTEPYCKSVAHFLSETMPRLWRLGSPENVRIVFFFDN